MTQHTTATTEAMAGPRWVGLIGGIAAIVAGILLLTSPAEATLILVQILGLYWLFRGVFALVSVGWDRTLWGWKVLGGIVGILAGVLIIQHPLWSTVLVPTTLVLVLGIQGIIVGAVELVAGFGGSGWEVGILGVISIIFGVVLLFNPLIGAATLPWLLGVVGIVGGAAEIIYAFRKGSASYASGRAG